MPEKRSKPASKATAKRTAQQKKAETQVAALDALESFVAGLVTTGLGSLGEKGRAAIEAQMARAADADLSGPRDLLRRLSALLGPEPAAIDLSEEARRALAGLRLQPPRRPHPEERAAHAAGLLTRLWTTLRRGKKALAAKAAGEPISSEEETFVASILGRRWRLEELIAAGYALRDRTLFELAHEQVEDDVNENLLTSGYLLDLGDGSIWLERTIIPYQALHAKGVYHRVSRTQALELREAALYPGPYVNRRIRWSEKDAGGPRERPRTSEDYARLHALAQPVAAGVARLKEQMKHPLATGEAVVLLRAASFGLAGAGPDEAKLVLEDGEGGRLVFRDPPRASFFTTENLYVAASGFGPGSVAVRLWIDPLERAIYGQALALVVGEEHLRLGL